MNPSTPSSKSWTKLLRPAVVSANIVNEPHKAQSAKHKAHSTQHTAYSTQHSAQQSTQQNRAAINQLALDLRKHTSPPRPASSFDTFTSSLPFAVLVAAPSSPSTPSDNDDDDDDDDHV